MLLSTCPIVVPSEIRVTYALCCPFRMPTSQRHAPLPSCFSDSTKICTLRTRHRLLAYSPTSTKSSASIGTIGKKRFLVQSKKGARAITTITTPLANTYVYQTVVVRFNASDKHLNTVLLLINNTLKADGPWKRQQNETINIEGSYNWDTTKLSLAGIYTITILAFDEHGATNGPSTSTVTVNHYPPIAIPEISATPLVILILFLSTLTLICAKLNQVHKLKIHSNASQASN